MIKLDGTEVQQEAEPQKTPVCVLQCRQTEQVPCGIEEIET